MVRIMFFHMLLPLLAFCVLLAAVMWPGVFMSAAGMKRLGSRFYRNSRIMGGFLIGASFLWLQFFLSGWAFYVGYQVCANLHAGIGEGWMCYVTGFVMAMVPGGVVATRKEIHPFLDLALLLVTGITYFVTIVRPEAIAAVYGWLIF